jgi:hypothetical protein
VTRSARGRLLSAPSQVTADDYLLAGLLGVPFLPNFGF